MQARLVFNNLNEKKSAEMLGIKKFDKIYNLEDLIKGDVIFCATGVTSGDILKGIEVSGSEFLSETLVLHKSSKTNTIIKNKSSI